MLLSVAIITAIVLSFGLSKALRCKVKHEFQQESTISAGRMVLSVFAALTILIGLHLFIQERRSSRSIVAKIMKHHNGIQQHVAMALKNRR